ncbi:hypothetical protein M3Y99_01919100 [Aphelenchoides fujianensis]|nr:hypothetical protein M3Y99_01919100 [Aphelenchoides fujianensis]
MSSLFFPRRMPFKDGMLFLQHVHRSADPTEDEAAVSMVGADMSFSPHHLLAAKFTTPETSANSWRVLGLSAALSLTCLLLVFYVLKLIWHRFRAHNVDFDGLLQKSPTDWSAIEETALIDEDFYSTP